MTDEYSYNELMQMQENAIKRVQQMQERARQTIKNDPLFEHDFKENAEEKPQEKPQERPQEKSQPEPEIEENTPKAKAEKVNTPNYTPPRSSPLSNLLTIDRDKAMILPLLMLLGKEGADSILLIALMYIIA